VDKTVRTAEAGDVVVITGHRVGEASRMGEILEVVGKESHQLYRVRWEDGHESLFAPGSDATIRHSTARRAARKVRT
jgi:hypothetical protein